MRVRVAFNDGTQEILSSVAKIDYNKETLAWILTGDNAGVAVPVDNIKMITYWNEPEVAEEIVKEDDVV